MQAKSSAHYQREYRKRLREMGLVKKEVWVRPEHANQLTVIEKQLRVPGELTINAGACDMTEHQQNWTTEKFFSSIKESDYVSQGQLTVEMIDGVDPSLQIVMHEYGDLPVYFTASGEQIIVEAVLWSADDVKDKDGFNEAVLRTHKYFPLSTVSLDTVSKGSDYYYMFGALSSASSFDNIIAEIEMLGSNVIQATEAYQEFLSLHVEAV